MLALVVENHSHRPGTHLRRIGWGSLRHGSSLSRVGASGNPGTVHTADLIELARQYGRYGYRKITALARGMWVGG